ncbi:MAG: class I SAM-dependent methyltransferase [Oligoflexia bacterium]|nr:class I SAM-dependent methyltransferase [Oligoflexia bacterium]
MMQCRQCGSPLHKNILPDLSGLLDRFQGTQGIYSYSQCLDCKLIQLTEDPNDMAALYYHYSINKTKSFFYDFIRAVLIAPKYPQLNGRGVLLDIGPGDGWYMTSLQKKGWDCYGVELSEEMACKIRQQAKLNIFSIENINQQKFHSFFDVITFNFSFEHLTNPLDMLDAAQILLRKGGQIIITIPNIESLSFKFFVKNWFDLDPPRHITFFTKTMLADILIQKNFKIKSIVYISSANDIAGSLLYCFKNKFNKWPWYFLLPLGVLLQIIFKDSNFRIEAEKK